MSDDNMNVTTCDTEQYFVTLDTAKQILNNETTVATGSDVNYYLVEVPHPKRLPPYVAECEDIIESLGMTFAEGNVFKALWRSCVARTHGLTKPGAKQDGIYDAEKMLYYSERILAKRKG